MNGYNNYDPNGYNPYQYQQEPPMKKPEPKIWSIFATIGFIGGLSSLVLAFIPYLNLVFSFVPEACIVLSALGIKSSKKKGMAISGLILSIVGFILMVVSLSVLYVEIFNDFFNFSYSGGYYY